MLSQLLLRLAQTGGELDLNALSRELGAQPTAVQGMIETLVHKGHLIEIDPACGVCDSCGLSRTCRLPVRRARRYRIVAPGERCIAEKL